MWSLKKLIAKTKQRKPDMIIGATDPEGAYLHRWWLIPRNRFFNIYLHKFLRSDEAFALHDHPWLFNASWLLEGEYIEHLPRGRYDYLQEGRFKFRWGRATHRVQLFDSNDDPLASVFTPEPCWTIFITGPVVRMWGFDCPKGWVPFSEIVSYDEAKGTSTPKRACP